TIDVDVRNSPEPQARIATAIAKHRLSGAVVRVRIDATAEQAALLRTDEIQGQLEQAEGFHTAAIAIEVERAGRSRLGAAGRDRLEGFTRARALEPYLRPKTTPDDRIEALLAAAEELLAEQSS